MIQNSRDRVHEAYVIYLQANHMFLGLCLHDS